MSLKLQTIVQTFFCVEKINHGIFLFVAAKRLSFELNFHLIFCGTHNGFVLVEMGMI